MPPKPKLRVTEPPDDVPRPVTDEWERAADVRNEKLNWLLPGRLLGRSLAILEGEKGVGKSTFSCALVAALTKGSRFLGRKKQHPGSVLWLPGEEDVASVVVPRLQAAGANLDNVHFTRKDERGIRRRLQFPTDTALLHDAIAHFKVCLVIVDPLSSFVAPEVCLKDDQSIHQALDPLADVAFATGCTICVSRNLTKNHTANRIDRGLGGAAVAGVARSVLVIDWPDRDNTRRVLRVVAGNLTAPTPAVEYHLEAKGDWAAVAKLKEIPEEADTAQNAPQEIGERDKLGRARMLLRRLLGSGWVRVKDIQSEARDAMISERTLDTAKAEMRIRHRRVGRATPAYWEWGPPEEGWK